MKRRSWIEPNEEISVVRQCELASITRSTVYAQRRPVEIDETDRRGFNQITGNKANVFHEDYR